MTAARTSRARRKMPQLAEDGLAQEALQPLIELEAALKSSRSPAGVLARPERPAPPSEAMLGRIATVIDLLVEAGYDEADAAQMIMRRLLALGVLPPRQGGDARSWSASSFGGPICVTAWPRSVACPQAATA